VQQAVDQAIDIDCLVHQLLQVDSCTHSHRHKHSKAILIHVKTNDFNKSRMSSFFFKHDQ
jgi:hypothetical protein